MSDIAKGKLSAYQRWEMISFEDENNPGGLSTGSRHASSNQSTLDQLKLKAQKEGFAKGFEEGHQVGLKTGQQEGRQPWQHELASLQQIGTQFSASIQQAEQLIAQEVLDLALDLAKAMLKTTLKINPEFIIPIIEQAIASLPSVQKPAQLFLHPGDAALVTSKIGTELVNAGWVIINDPHLGPGDCRVETSKNQIDASLTLRWKQLTEALGRDNQWMDTSAGDSNGG